LGGVVLFTKFREVIIISLKFIDGILNICRDNGNFVDFDFVAPLSVFKLNKRFVFENRRNELRKFFHIKLRKNSTSGDGRDKQHNGEPSNDGQDKQRNDNLGNEENDKKNDKWKEK